jgi:hypothetical protein
MNASRQKAIRVTNASEQAPIGEIVAHLRDELRLPSTDADGRPLTYHARLSREARHLLASERVGDALQSGDELILQPSIDAGAGGLPLAMTGPGCRRR